MDAALPVASPRSGAEIHCRFRIHADVLIPPRLVFALCRD
jgi:hypothetical protein